MIGASRERVWEFITEKENLVRCIPGCEEAQSQDSDTLVAAVRLGVDDTSARWRVEVSVVNALAPEHLEAVGRGLDDGLANSFHLVATLDLVAKGRERTIMRYKLDVKLFGKLGEMGASAMRQKANQLAEEFAQNLARRIESRRRQGRGA